MSVCHVALLTSRTSAYFNNETYVAQNTPTLFTALTTGEDAMDPRVYGQVNPIIYKKGEIIDVTINNLSPGHHPFHMHGHHFQVLYRGAGNAGRHSPQYEDFPDIPMRRDTFTVNGVSSAVIRFKAENPGVWLFHCHLEWHMPLGMIATFIEDPLELQKSIGEIPKANRELCEAQGKGTGGNAAGNTEDHFNLDGATPADAVPTNG